MYYRRAIILFLLALIHPLASLCQSDLRIVEVFDRAKVISDSLKFENPFPIKLISKIHSGFDFETLEFIDGPIDSTDYYCGYYDSIGRLVKLRHFEKVERIFNFELHFFQSSGFVIMGLNHFSSMQDTEGYGFMPAFFVYDKLTRRIYLVSTLNKHYVSTTPIFWIGKISSVTAISVINSSFYLTNVLHFKQLSLTHHTEVQFEDDGKTVKGERLFYYNSRLPVQLVVDKDLTFGQIEQFIQTYRADYLDALPCLSPTDRSFPLWVYCGLHEICW